MAFDAYAYSESNVGVNATLWKDTAATVETNVGVPLPTLVGVHLPQIGWGTPMTPASDTTLLKETANGYAYAEEEVTS